MRAIVIALSARRPDPNRRLHRNRACRAVCLLAERCSSACGRIPGLHDHDTCDGNILLYAYTKCDKYGARCRKGTIGYLSFLTEFVGRNYGVFRGMQTQWGMQ